MLKEAGIRVELDDHDESLGKKIRQAKLEKVPYIVVIGDKEIESKTLTVEKRDGTKEEHTIEAFLEKIQREIKNRSL
jgi:threonyl-tRNA synthetase